MPQLDKSAHCNWDLVAKNKYIYLKKKMTAKSLTLLPVKRWNVILLPLNVSFRNLLVMKRMHQKQHRATSEPG